MIVPAGVLVPVPQVEAVLAALEAELRRRPVFDVPLLGLVEELRSIVLAGGSVASGGVDATEGFTVPAAARMLGLGENAVRRGLREGRIDGRKVNGRWLIRSW